MVYRYVCNGFLRQIRLRSYQSALPVPRILVLCNHLQNVVATTYIFRLQLSTFIFYNKQALADAKEELHNRLFAPEHISGDLEEIEILEKRAEYLLLDVQHAAMNLSDFVVEHEHDL